MNFVVTKNFKSPYAVATGLPHKPTGLKTMPFKKGQIISGELKKDGRGDTAFVMYKGTIVVPLDCVKQVVTKEVNMSNAVGPVRSSIVMNRPQTKVEEKNMYIDAIILGAIAGFASVYYAEKKGMIETTSMNNKIIGAALGGAAFGYLTYRFKNKKK